MMVHQWLTVIGLGLDIVGVIVVFVHVLPSRIPTTTWEYKTPESERVEAKVRRLAWTGLVILVLGFGLQIAGTVYTPSPQDYEAPSAVSPPQALAQMKQPELYL